MSAAVYIKQYKEPPVNNKEISRYMGGGDFSELVALCLKECRAGLSYRVCYARSPVSIKGEEVIFPFATVKSRDLAKNLSGVRRVVIFAATVGVELDRLIAKYGRLSASKGICFQAIGAERIEALCDKFCADFEKENSICLKPRFSPGYGDLPLEFQKEIFRVLDCPRKIGLSLLDSLLMSPSKSVTAIAGISEEEISCESPEKCKICGNFDCIFRSDAK